MIAQGSAAKPQRNLGCGPLRNVIAFLRGMSVSAACIETIHEAQVGLTGADVAIAATGTMVVSTEPGKGRLPTVLAPIHIAVITLEQIVPRLEDWLARQRAQGLDSLWNRANTCFISGPSKTADIEMELIYGAHGPGIVQVVVKK